MLHIGITGGVGAGKSEILKYLEQEYNCRVLLADEVAHDLMEPGTDCYSRLRQLFAGDGVFAEDGRIDRPALARVLFSDEEKRKACDGIVHPAVWDAVAKQAEEERQRGDRKSVV